MAKRSPTDPKTEEGLDPFHRSTEFHCSAIPGTRSIYSSRCGSEAFVPPHHRLRNAPISPEPRQTDSNAGQPISYAYTIGWKCVWRQAHLDIGRPCHWTVEDIAVSRGRRQRCCPYSSSRTLKDKTAPFAFPEICECRFLCVPCLLPSHPDSSAHLTRKQRRRTICRRSNT